MNMSLIDTGHSHTQVEKCGISPMERDNDGATPVHFAAARGMHFSCQLIVNKFL